MVKAESSEVTGQAARDILESLIAPEFVGFLEKLTGIEGLIADPTHTWAGIHVCPVGSSQAVHRDFRLHPTNGLYHRVNVLVYLNTIWKEEYGGELELWPSDMSACGKQVLPIAGRVVIFETTPSTCHGVPDPIRCPPEIARLSLASYYYTDYPSPVDRRSPLFLAPRRPQDPWYMRFQPLHESMYRLWRVFVQSLTRRSVKPRSTDEIGE
jgi:Rps23 Pro-64 3,4-dihydroxylase Tpa1-like proline 4-hydroxylase